jgi:D-alanyl-D-alanine carboxypeptidase (penicillin-binding protein 5/6)
MTGKFPAPLSRYCVLMDARSGKVLYARNAYAHREPASTTKMMAATILLEQGKLSDIVTAPPGIDKVPPSSLHLAPGEKINLEDLLYAMMLRSANDTPVAGAYYLCKGTAPFVALMNAKAKEIGCTNTHFVTPNGLYDPNHYSCASDLATIARYAMTTLPVFREIVKTQRRKINRSVHKRDNIVENTATTFLKDFPGADGVKTGYISQAGHCFVGSATRGGWELIAVALDSGKCRSDVVQMLSYGYAQFSPVLAIPKGTAVGTVLVDAGRPAIPAVTGGDLWDVVSKKQATGSASYTTRVTPITLPPNMAVALGQKVGTVTLLNQGKAVMQTDALAASALSARALPLKSSHGGRALRLIGEIAAGIIGLIALAVLARVLGIVLNARQAAKNSRLRRSRITPGL